MTSYPVHDLTYILLLGGLASWTTLAAFNNLRAFGHGAKYLGFIMGMTALKLPDVPDNPLMSRAVHSETLHKAAMALIALAEIAVAALLWCAVYQVAGTGLDAGSGVLAASFAVLGLMGFMGLAMLLLISGSWFAYYSHLEQAQLTHFAMIILALVGLNGL